MYVAAGTLKFPHCEIIKTNSNSIQIQPFGRNRCHGLNVSLGFHTHAHTDTCRDKQFQSVKGMKPAEQVPLIVTKRASTEFLWWWLSCGTHETLVYPHRHMLYSVRCVRTHLEHTNSSWTHTHSHGCQCIREPGSKRSKIGRYSTYPRSEQLRGRVHHNLWNRSWGRRKREN